MPASIIPERVLEVAPETTSLTIRLKETTDEIIGYGNATSKAVDKITALNMNTHASLASVNLLTHASAAAVLTNRQPSKTT